MEALRAGAEELGLVLSGEQLAAFGRYQAHLLAWNKRVNLTSVGEPAAVETVLLLDSLACAAPLLARWGSAAAVPPLRCIDVGAGAGLPGLPLKLVLPQLRLTLLEATGKKTEFLAHMVRELGLADVTVLTARAETVAHEAAHRERYDLALARALAGLPTLLELTLPFLAPGGLLVAPRRGDLAAELAQARAALGALGGAARPPAPVPVAALADGRALVLVDKVAPTPAAYPRRPGMPAKRPLGGSAGRAAK